MDSYNLRRRGLRGSPPDDTKAPNSPKSRQKKPNAKIGPTIDDFNESIVGLTHEGSQAEDDVVDETDNGNNGQPIANESLKHPTIPSFDDKSNEELNRYLNQGNLLKQQLKNIDKKLKINNRTDDVIKSHQQSSKTGSNGILKLLIWVIMALVFGYIFKIYGIFDKMDDLAKSYFNTEGEKGIDFVSKWQTFQIEFKKFELKYEEFLPSFGIKVIKSAVKNVIDRNSSSQFSYVSPAMILLIASKDNLSILKCLETDLINAINKAYNENNPIIINGKQTNSENIINSFDQNFAVDRKHSIVIENIESIAAEDVMSLHQFTDHQNAKYKDVIIVMTAINYQKINLTKSARPKHMDQIATQLFQIKWKNDLPEEQGFALISRLTPSVVTIIGQTKDQMIC